MDAMLEKLSLLERMDQLLQKWEHTEKVFKPRKKKGIVTNLRGPHVGLEAVPQEESSIGEKSTEKRGVTTDPIPEEIPCPSLSETE